MECLTAKDKIQETFDKVSEISKQKNEAAIKQQTINKLLDTISEFKSLIQSKTDNLELLNKQLQEVSWLQDLDEECILMIKGILLSLKKIYTNYIKFYVKLGWTIRQDIATETMRAFKLQLDDLKERTEDLTDLFFDLPADVEFTERIKLLSK